MNLFGKRTVEGGVGNEDKMPEPDGIELARRAEEKEKIDASTEEVASKIMGALNEEELKFLVKHQSEVTDLLFEKVTGDKPVYL